MMGNTCLIHNLSRQVSAVTGKNEWSCLWLLGREIAAVFGRSAQVNVLYAVPLLIPSCVSLARDVCVCVQVVWWPHKGLGMTLGVWKREVLFPVTWKHTCQRGLSVPGCSRPALMSTGTDGASAPDRSCRLLFKGRGKKSGNSFKSPPPPHPHSHTWPLCSFSAQQHNPLLAVAVASCLSCALIALF